MCLFNQENDNSHYFTFFMYRKGKDNKDRIRTKTAKSILFFIMKPFDTYTNLKQPYYSD